MIKQFKTKNNLIDFTLKVLDYASEYECITLYECPHFLPQNKLDFVKIDLGHKNYDAVITKDNIALI